MRKILLCTALFLVLPGLQQAGAANYQVQKVAERVYAAIALPEGKAASNAMIVVTDSEVILAGAHFLAEGVKELVAEIAKITPLPVRHVILTHHHRGFNYIDFDLPAGAEVVTSWQTWQALKSETRAFKNEVIVFDSSLTMAGGKLSIVINNVGFGHSDGDVVVFLPAEGVLFASDLFYNDVVGYMGEGYMREWVLNLEMLETLDARVVIPGVGKVSNVEGIERFLLFLKEFLTEVLMHVEGGDSLAETLKGFELPQYDALPGYKTFLKVNVERAYDQLKAK